MQDWLRLDPGTVFVALTLMMVFNGVVLGLLQRGLAPDVQESMRSWRHGTLLQALGVVLMAVQDRLPLALVLPLANGLLLVGVTLYLHALRRFRDRALGWPLALLPSTLGVAGVIWFTVVQPQLAARIACVSFLMAVPLFASIQALRGDAHFDPGASGRVLRGLMVGVCAVVVLRGLQALLFPPPEQYLLQSNSSLLILQALLLAVLPVVGTSAFLVMCSERLRHQWERAASTDHLTGLANRFTLMLELQRAVQRSRATGTPLSLLLLDVDHFKRLNDSHGHAAGDAGLTHLAGLLREASGSHLAARVGGEEFCVLCPGSPLVEAHALALRLQALLAARPLVWKGQAMPVTVSVGVAQLGAGDADPEALLGRADHALYAAKSAGRDRVESAQPALV